MKITFIGAGNVATHLADAMAKAGHDIMQIYSRTAQSARELADRIGCKSIATKPDELNCDSDLYVMSVTDNALPQLAQQLTEGRDHALWVHTAGSIPMDVLPCERRGVFYPMQTFSKQKAVDFRSIPIFIEAHNADDAEVLRALAATLSDNVYPCSSDKRAFLHLAAVFCCNFANHCSTLSAHLLEKHGIPFDVMLPLIDETIGKLHTMHPRDAQTGPAVRNDSHVIAKHVQMLDAEGEHHLSDIYQLMSKSIQTYDKL